MSITTNRAVNGVGSDNRYLVPAPTGSDDAIVSAALASGAKVIEFAAGTYVLSSIQSIPGNTTIVGQGASVTTFQIAAGTNLGYMFRTVNSSTDINIQDCGFDGNYANQSSGSNMCFNGTAANNLNRLRITNCNFKNSRDYCVRLGVGRSFIVQGCMWTGTYGQCLTIIGSRSVSIIGCSFYDYNIAVGLNPAIQIQQDATYQIDNVTVTGCTFRSQTSDEFAIEATCALTALPAESITISGNTFDGNAVGGSGISLAAQRLSITGNTFLSGINTWRTGLELAALDATVCNNVIENGAIVLSKAGTLWGEPKRVIVNGNFVSLQGSTGSNLAAIHIGGGNTIAVNNNMIYINLTGGASGSGMFLNAYGELLPTAGISVVGNTIVNESGSVAAYGMRILGGAAGIVKKALIALNRIEGFAVGIQGLSGNSSQIDSRVLFNTFDSCTNATDGSARGAGWVEYGNKTAIGDGPLGSYQLKTTTYTATNYDDVILADTSGGGWTLTLPAWPTNGKTLTVKKSTTDANTLTIAHNQNQIDAAVANVTTALTTLPVLSFTNIQVSKTATVTIASPGVVSATAHKLISGSAVVFSTDGALPTGITAGTIYYVIATGLTADAFQFSATVGGAAVNTSGTQSGTHTVQGNRWWTITKTV
jgi:hypothetical protein